MTPNQFSIYLKSAFDTAKVQAAANKAVGARGVFIIDKRTREGRFLGGSRANAGYSTRPLSLSFLGEWKSIGKGMVSLKNTRGNITSAFTSEELQWRGKKGQRGGTPFLKGGYKAYREKTGRDTSKVNLTFTGKMLTSLFFTLESIATGLRVRFTVTPPEMDKAVYTHSKRNWLTFSDAELNTLSEGLQKELSDGLK